MPARGSAKRHADFLLGKAHEKTLTCPCCARVPLRRTRKPRKLAGNLDPSPACVFSVCSFPCAESHGARAPIEFAGAGRSPTAARHRRLHPGCGHTKPFLPRLPPCQWRSRRSRFRLLAVHLALWSRSRRPSVTFLAKLATKLASRLFGHLAAFARCKLGTPEDGPGQSSQHCRFDC